MISILEQILGNRVPAPTINVPVATKPKINPYSLAARKFVTTPANIPKVNTAVNSRVLVAKKQPVNFGIKPIHINRNIPRFPTRSI